MNRLLPLLSLTILLALSGCDRQPPAPFAPGPLTPALLQSATARTGFKVRELELDQPRAIHPRLPFRSFASEDSLLVRLRERFDLPAAIDGAPDEWQAQLRLMDWLHSKIENGIPEVEAEHALEILEYAETGKKFWCSYYAIAYAECAQALGWQARKLALDVRQDGSTDGSQHHGAAEVWSNQWGKWIFIDPQSNLHFEKDGVPLSAWEVRSEWLRDGGGQVRHLVGLPPAAEHRNPAVVWWKLDQDETSLFFWLFYTDSYATWEKGSPSKFLFPRDSANAGLTWYQNTGQGKGRLHTGYTNELFLETDRIEDAYWTVGVTETQLLEAGKGTVVLSLDSWCPELAGYEADRGAGWQPVERPDSLVWELAEGENHLALRTRNRAGWTGPVTTLGLRLD